MEKPLNDEAIYPTDQILKSLLGNSFLIYSEFIATISSEKYKLTYEWKYYNDGKSWLLKICYKKKTIIWSSVNQNYFNVTFYFPNRSDVDINNLNINIELKQQFTENKDDSKKSNHITISVKNINQLYDIYTIIEYKKTII